MKTLSYSRRRNNRDDTQASGTPAWMVTYGDMVTQVLLFFVLLFSLSTVDAKKFDLALISLQESLGILQGGQTVVERDFLEAGDIGQAAADEEERELKLLQSRLDNLIEDYDIEGIQVSMDERGITIRFIEGVLFDSGKARLKENAKSILDKIAPVLKSCYHHLRVEGHTDNLPISTREFPSNWELSTTRAVNVIKYFIEKHRFSPYTLSAAGYGEYRPIAPNDTEKHRALNRRVDLIVLRTDLEDKEPK
ncbi:MAG: OmpA family protein [Tepidanaerobacteraceae bacterium]